MIVALWLMAIQGLIGAFDTFYYHEWVARLPARGRAVASELHLHAARDFFYAVLFGTLPIVAWHGLWLLVLATVLVGEILLTLADFVVEFTVRKPLGDVSPGERVTHAVMGILYGAMLANLLPNLWAWSALPTGITIAPPEIPGFLRAGLLLMAIGVGLSGARDLYAAFGLPYGHWPWRVA